MIPIPVDAVPASSLNFDLYFERERGAAPVLYRKRWHPLEQADLERLLKRGVQTLYVPSVDQEAFREQMFEEVCQDETVSPERRYKVLRDVNRVVFDMAFRGRESEDLMSLLSSLAPQLAFVICREDLVVRDLFSLMEHDSGIYTHCVNVAVYCLILAAALGMTDMAELEELAMGALLHDIGKRHVQLAGTKQMSGLTRQQREQLQRHPTVGFQELVLRDQYTWAQLMVVYQHHERIDGQGSPVGSVEHEIHPWARICAIADVFHSITSDNAVRAPLTIEQALNVIDQQAGASFDREIAKCWNTKVWKKTSSRKS
ncbi:MAG: HD domain-containing protein [Pirellulales bacterium]|nr:HD domain-containing protein [Pirellulales bacterium]